MTVEPFSITPKAAVDFFKQKGLKTTFAWQDMLHEEHSRNFTVAKMLDMALLKDVHDAVEEAVSQGMTLHQFRERLEPLMVDKGWWGRKEMIDPETGEVIEAQLGSPNRLKTIFETNMKTAFSAAEWDQIKATAEMMPYLMYTAVKDGLTRDEHLAWDGIVLRWDDDFWKTHFPPNGWNCRCFVIQLGERDLKAVGKSGPDEAPKGGTFTWTNPRTGDEMEIPDGIDPGWAYHPGEGRDSVLYTALSDRVISLPRDMAEAAVESVFEEQFDSWYDNPVGNFPVMSVIPEAQQAVGAETSVAVLSSETLIEKKHSHPDLSLEDWHELPGMGSDPDEIIQDGDQTFVLIRQGSELFFAAVKATKSRKALFVTTYHRISEEDAKRVRQKGKTIWKK